MNRNPVEWHCLKKSASDIYLGIAPEPDAF
jgi:hypothetical protein